jgi:hypothetical protein
LTFLTLLTLRSIHHCYLLTARSLRVLPYVFAFSEWHISCSHAPRDLKHPTLTFCR